MRKLSFMLMFICLFTIVLTSCVPKQEVIPEEPPKEEIILPVWYKVSYVDSNDKQLAVEYVDEGEFAPEKDYTTYFKVGDHPGYEGGFFSLDGVNPYTYDQPIVSNTVLKAVLIKWNRQKMYDDLKGFYIASYGFYSYHLFIDDRLNYILCSSWAGAQTKYVATVDSDISWGKISWDDAKLQLFLESADIKEFYLNCGLTGGYLYPKLSTSDFKIWRSGSNQDNLVLGVTLVADAYNYKTVMISGFKFSFTHSSASKYNAISKQVKEKIGLTKYNSIYHES